MSNDKSRRRGRPSVGLARCEATVGGLLRGRQTADPALHRLPPLPTLPEPNLEFPIHGVELRFALVSKF